MKEPYEKRLFDVATIDDVLQSIDEQMYSSNIDWPHRNVWNTAYNHLVGIRRKLRDFEKENENPSNS